MPTLLPCPSCACHVTEGTCRCPHCGNQLRTCGNVPARTAAAALLGLAVVAGCVNTGQSKYDGGTYDSTSDYTVGDADTDADSDSDTDTDTDTDTDPTGDTGP